LNNGTGITTSGTYPNFTIANSLPDQTVALTGSGSTTISGTYPSFNVDSTNTTYTAGSGLSLVGTEFSNTAPDQTVAITGSNAATVTGTYPNFNVSSPSISAGASMSLDVTNPNNIVINNTAPDQVVSLTASTGIQITGTYPSFTITNTSDPAIVESVNGEIGVVVLDSDNISEGVTNLYDKTVAITGGGATTVTGTYPNFSITSTDTNTQYTAGTGLLLIGQQFSNTAPDQLVTITGGGGTTVTGSYPNFTVSSSTSGSGLDSVVAGTSIGVDNTDPANPIITNTAPDQTVVLTGAGGTTITGTYPNFTVSSTAGGSGVDSVVGGTSITIDNADPLNPIINNSSPDQTVVLTGSGAATVTGTYPSFNVATPVVNTADFITNANDVYPSVNKVTDIISLTQAEYDALTPDESAIYIIVG